MAYEKRNFVDGTTKLDKALFDHLQNGIAEANGEIIVPSHWSSYMVQKVEEINTLNEANGADCDTFIFLTDTHWPSHNNGESLALVKYIMGNTSIDKLFFGGDTIHPESEAIGLATARELRKALRGIKYCMVRGNHDSDYNALSQFYDPLYRLQGDYCAMTTSPDYYYDIEAQKIRYIFMDTIYGHEAKPVTTEAQIQWMKDLILELEDGWTVMVFRHSIWNPEYNSAAQSINIDAQLIIDALDEIYDTAKCRIAGIWAGHSHRDGYEKSAKGYALITTTCDNCDYSSGYDLENPTRTAGTTEAQAFDVVNINTRLGVINAIRIGAGKNRVMTYDIPKKYLDLSALVWEQGHFDINGVNTETTHQSYNYRLRSNVLEIPAEARGKTLYFDIEGDFEINFRAGDESNVSKFMYYYITADKSVLDAGVDGDNRGYAVTLPADATHMRLMMSHDNGDGQTANNTKPITVSEAPDAGLKIWY